MARSPRKRTGSYVLPDTPPDQYFQLLFLHQENEEILLPPVRAVRLRYRHRENTPVKKAVTQQYYPPVYNRQGLQQKSIKTKGFVIASKRSTPSDIGDEPYQIYQKYGHEVRVAVCESRVKGIEEQYYPPVYNRQGLQQKSIKYLIAPHRPKLYLNVIRQLYRFVKVESRALRNYCV